MVDAKNTRKILRVLKKIGFTQGTKIVDTLQGSIWRAEKKKKTSPGETAIIKITDQHLHKHSLTVPINGNRYHVKEDILLEQSILKYLTEQENVPKSVVKFEKFCRSNSSYYLVMEDGGSSLFNFINKSHQLARLPKVEVCNWSEVVHIIFKQMIECIDYIHSKNVCHFDISLENFVINDVDIEVVKSINTHVHKLKFVTDNIQIKLVDFGLAQLFTKSDCLSSKICGKMNYKSPEVISKKKGFDAKKNDIWCLGVCLFSMATGGSIWDSASENNIIFQHVMSGHLQHVLKKWKFISNNYDMDNDLIDLLQSIFQYESCRIKLKSIKAHEWLKKNE
eukprot:976793_1